MTTFETLPTDEELQSFADPDGTPPYVWLEDDGTILTAKPRPLPAWFIWGSLLLPAAAAYAGIIWQSPFKDPEPLWRFLWGLFALMIPVAVISTGLLVRWLTRRHVRLDVFFILDRAAGTLTLPRVGLTLRRGDVVELVEVRDTFWKWAGDGWGGDYIIEVSVIVRDADGKWVRHSVMAAGYAKPVRRVAAELAELFGVPRRILTRPALFGRWRREE
jgi:hypothetical protein